MDLTRTFQKQFNDRLINICAQYDMKTHGFNIVEDDGISYQLHFDKEHRRWFIIGTQQPTVPVDDLAHWVQESYGYFL